MQSKYKFYKIRQKWSWIGLSRQLFRAHFGETGPPSHKQISLSHYDIQIFDGSISIVAVYFFLSKISQIRYIVFVVAHIKNIFSAVHRKTKIIVRNRIVT